MKQLQFADGKMIGAEKYGQEEEEIKVALTPEEEKMAQSIKVPTSHEQYVTSAQKVLNEYNLVWFISLMF